MRDLPMIAMAEWLAQLGLARYVGVFADNSLGLDIVTDLSETDLEAMGILLGDRKRLLRAIAEIRDAKSQTQWQPATSPVATPTSSASRASWRRHLTVLFCDLVGSTSLSHQLDPEDLDRVIQNFQLTCSASIGRNSGYIARFMGDGILAYFGYPQAREGDAESAARAALDIVRNVRLIRAPDGDELHVRVGIATGLVLVLGEAIGTGEAREQSVVGKTPNLAARLQSMAEPDTILISHSTRELLGDGMFACDDLGLHHIRGLDDPVQVWQVLEERRNTSRFDATRSTTLTRMVGRAAQLARLRELWECARGGAGRVALLSGEAGMGKSRLCRTMLDEIAASSHHLLLLQCSPHHTQSPLQPVIGQMELAGGFDPDDSSDLKLDKLLSLAGVDGGDDVDVPVLAALLSIPAELRYPLPELSPASLRKRTIEALLRRMLRLAAERPVVLVVEDMQWVDPTTLEFLGRVLEAAQRSPLLGVVTCRPEFVPPWEHDARVSRLSIGRLDESEVLTLIGGLTLGRALPASVCREIVDRTDGVPLFVEELTRSVIESGLMREVGSRYELDGPLRALSIPSTLQETLMARLDRLDSVREVAQVAAALGRVFPFQLLSKVTNIPDGELVSLLAKLDRADLIHGEGAFPDIRYMFKHSLVQGAAYDTLLRSRRPGLHARIARVLQESFEALAAAQPEVVAHHLTEAQLPLQAIEWWRRAGRCRVETSANAEAVVHLGRALSLLDALPADAVRDKLELETRIALCVPLMGTCGYTAQEFQANADRALMLCERDADGEQIYPVLWSQFARSFSSGDVGAAQSLATRFLDSAQRQDHRQLRMIGHRLCGMAFYGAGQLQAAREQLERSLALYDAASDVALAYVYGADQRVAAVAYLGRTLFLLGDVQQGVHLAEQALSEARQIDHANTVLYAEGCLLELHMMRRDFEALRTKCADVARLANGHSARNYMVVAQVVDEIMTLGEHDDADKLAAIDSGLAELHDLNWTYWVTRLALLAAESGVGAGHVVWARSWLDKAAALISNLGQGVCVPEMRQVEARLHEAERADGGDILERPSAATARFDAVAPG